MLLNEVLQYFIIILNLHCECFCLFVYFLICIATLVGVVFLIYFYTFHLGKGRI